MSVGRYEWIEWPITHTRGWTHIINKGFEHGLGGFFFLLPLLGGYTYLNILVG